MNRSISPFFAILLVGLLWLPAFSQCLDGNCVNGTGVKLTRGHKYTGEFKDNHRHGFGLYEYPNGDKYEGQFVDGIIEGIGTYYYINGDRFEGNFKNGKRNGVGTYYAKEGHTLKGVWANNELTIPEQMVESSELDDSLAVKERDPDARSAGSAADKPSEGTAAANKNMSDEELGTLVDDILKE